LPRTRLAAAAGPLRDSFERPEAVPCVAWREKDDRPEASRKKGRFARIKQTDQMAKRTDRHVEVDLAGSGGGRPGRARRGGPDREAD
jgi:hypothetical protein